MVAAPLKNKKIDSPIMSHFSKAKFFALLDEKGDIKLLINNADTPEHTIDILNIHGVDTLICAYLTQKTLDHATSLGIKVFDCGREPISLISAEKKRQDNTLIQIPTTVKRYSL